MTPEQEKKVADLDGRVASAKANPVLPGAAAGWLSVRRESATKVVPTTLVSMTGPPRTMRILPRGNWRDDSGEVVTPDVPAFLGSVAPADAKAQASRLDLAKWLASSDNPLMARVFANRLWKRGVRRGPVRNR